MTFRNADEYPVDIKRYNENWNEELVRSQLNPEQESTYETDFSSKWLFKRSDTAHRLQAGANGVTSQVFDGCRFKAKPGRFLRVTILAGKIRIIDLYQFINCKYIIQIMAVIFSPLHD